MDLGDGPRNWFAIGCDDYHAFLACLVVGSLLIGCGGCKFVVVARLSLVILGILSINAFARLEDDPVEGFPGKLVAGKRGVAKQFGLFLELVQALALNGPPIDAEQGAHFGFEKGPARFGPVKVLDAAGRILHAIGNALNERVLVQVKERKSFV